MSDLILELNSLDPNVDAGASLNVACPKHRPGSLQNFGKFETVDDLLAVFDCEEIGQFLVVEKLVDIAEEEVVVVGDLIVGDELGLEVGLKEFE